MSYDGSLKFDTKIDESGFSSGINKLGSIAKSGLSVLTSAITGVASAMGVGVSAAISVGSSFEAAMSEVQAISGATGDDLDALTEKAKEMGATTKFSATESAEALTYMAMAGWKTEDMLDGLEGIMNLAAASGEDLATTSDIVTDALTAFGLSAEDSGHFADVLAAASSNANTNVGLMGDTFKYVAPVAGALGYNAEDTAIAIGLMANSGIKASQAGTALRAIMSRITKPTTEVSVAMKKLGVSLTDSNGDMKSLYEVMGDLREGFAGLTEAESAEMAAALGGQEAMSGLLAIVNSSNADFEKLTDAIYSCDGAAESMAETMNDNLSGAFTILKSSAEGLGIEIYESMQEPLKGMAKLGTDAINELNAAFQENGVDGLIETGANLVANLVTGIAENAPMVIDMSVSVINSFIESIGNNLPSIISSGVQIGESFVIGAVQVMQSLYAVGSEIIGELVSGLMEAAPRLTENAGEIVSKLMQGIQENVPGMLTAAAELIASFAAGIGEQLPTLVPQALQMIVTIADGIISNIPTIVSAGLSILTGLVQGIIEGLPTLIAEGPRIINDFANAIYSAIGTLISTAWQLMIQFGQGLIAQIPLIKEHALEILQAIINMMSLSKMLSLGTKLISSLGNGIKSMLGGIKAAGGNVVTNLVNGIKAFASNPVAAIKNIATQAISAFKSFDWKSLGSNIINGIVNGLKAGVGAIVDAAKTAAKNAFDAAKEFLGIRSPSRLFRDVIGKNMALGMAVGFDGDIPAEAVEEGLDKIMRRAGKKVASINRSVPETTKGIISKVTNNYTGNGINYKKIKQAQKEALNEANERPIILNGRQVNRAMKDGEVVPV